MHSVTHSEGEIQTTTAGELWVVVAAVVVVVVAVVVVVWWWCGGGCVCVGWLVRCVASKNKKPTLRMWGIKHETH